MSLIRSASLPIACLVLAAGLAGQPAPLPDQDTFLREAREALARSQQVWHRYAYKERRTQVHMNPFGRMGTGDTLLYDVLPSPNPRLTYRRLVERNGVRLPQSQLDRQDAEYRQRAERIARSQRDADEVKRREQDELLARRRADMIVDDVLKTLEFELVRRETRDGRPSIVVSFQARPDARPSTREGRIAKVFKGNVWIDEASREVTYLNGEAIDDVSFGGFIAKIYEGTEAVVDRGEIEAGVWMPLRMSLKGTVRALFRRAQLDYFVEWFDYRRMD